MIVGIGDRRAEWTARIDMGTVAIEPVIEELQDGSRELRATGCLLLVGQPAALSFDGEQTADDRDRFEAARPVALA